MVLTSPEGTGSGVQLLTAVPSVARTNSTVGASASAPVIRYENVTARRAPTYARVRLVPVSTLTPASRPGTELSTAFGSGGGGGRIGIGLGGLGCACSGCAPAH